mmetsp:Transcript_14733/g.48076  ORF Transcript_14733/g.48076 Transcript_14733/m.48076 type:complete len:279 (+) Transcript_14733:866-1702(+)
MQGQPDHRSKRAPRRRCPGRLRVASPRRHSRGVLRRLGRKRVRGAAGQARDRRRVGRPRRRLHHGPRLPQRLEEGVPPHPVGAAACPQQNRRLGPRRVAPNQDRLAHEQEIPPQGSPRTHPLLRIRRMPPSPRWQGLRQERRRHHRLPHARVLRHRRHHKEAPREQKSPGSMGSRQRQPRHRRGRTRQRRRPGPLRLPPPDPHLPATDQKNPLEGLRLKQSPPSRRPGPPSPPSPLSSKLSSSSSLRLSSPLVAPLTHSWLAAFGVSFTRCRRRLLTV